MITSSSIFILSACLSPMDMKITSLVAAGQEMEQIANELHIYAESVIHHMTKAAKIIREVSSNV